MLLFVFPHPMWSFEKWREMRLPGIAEICQVIFVFQKGVIRPEKTLDLIRIKEFYLELIIRRPL